MRELIYRNEFRMVFRFSEKFAFTTCSTTTNGASIRGVTLGTKRSNIASTCRNKNAELRKLITSTCILRKYFQQNKLCRNVYSLNNLFCQFYNEEETTTNEQQNKRKRRKKKYHCFYRG